MIIRRTDELRPGDIVKTGHSMQRTVASATARPELESDIPELWEVQYAPLAGGPRGVWVAAFEIWSVFEPSPLDLAVRRAQELADTYQGEKVFSTVANYEFAKLLDLFRAAR